MRPQREILAEVLEALRGFEGELRRHKWFPSTPESPEWWAGYRDPFHIAVTAVLVRMNRWEQAERAMEELLRRGLGSPEALARASEEEIEEALRGVTLRKLKVKHLKLVAEAFSGGGGLEERVARAPIGRETRDSILLFALNKPVFPFSRQARRVLSRYGAKLGRGAKEEIERALGGDLYRLKLLHASLTVIAREYCKPSKPRCGLCPLSRGCARLT
ncbi:MAG: hypothetical protein N3F67_00365 [Acidilobaceae archaeon]|nr:hypothetical protein [Acidilobaceae archaeon]